MAVTLHRDLIGSEQHIVVSANSLTKIDTPTRLTVDGKIGSVTHGCIDRASQLSRHPLDVFVPVRYSRALDSVLSDRVQHIPWRHILSKQEYSEYIDRVVESVRSYVKHITSYCGIGPLAAFDSVLESLQVAEIDYNLLDEKLRKEQHPSQASVLESFYAPRVPQYDFVSSRTGRAIVKSGPNILTLRRTDRDIIKSRYGDGGKIYSIDFAALESRILVQSNSSCGCENYLKERDFYAAIAYDIMGNPDLRSLIKTKFITVMYGGQGESLGDQFAEREIEKLVDTTTLVKRLEQEYRTTGKYITNPYGMRVDITDPMNKIFVNSYVQSTGVYVAMNGFAKLLSMLPESVVPLYVLHDAIIVDAPRDVLQQYYEIVVKPFDVPFVLKTSIF